MVLIVLSSFAYAYSPSYTCSENSSKYILTDAFWNTTYDISVDGTEAIDGETLIAGGWDEGNAHYRSAAAIVEGDIGVVLDDNILLQESFGASGDVIMEVWFNYSIADIDASTDIYFRIQGVSAYFFGICGASSTTHYVNITGGNCDATGTATPIA
ncbi:unnamed protein product, partial [marine sediment metagenome]